jgi:hypothetical protein
MQFVEIIHPIRHRNDQVAKLLFVWHCCFLLLFTTLLLRFDLPTKNPRFFCGGCVFFACLDFYLLQKDTTSLLKGNNTLEARIHTVI